MSKSYNRSKNKISKRAKFNPEFWEIRVDQKFLDQFSLEENPHHETKEDVQARFRHEKWASRLMPLVLNLMDEVLTPRQREIVRLYFFEKLTENEISKQLDISVSSVSQHLFGKLRNRKTVGGAIPKLRKNLVQMIPEEFDAERKRALRYRSSFPPTAKTNQVDDLVWNTLFMILRLNDFTIFENS